MVSQSLAAQDLERLVAAHAAAEPTAAPASPLLMQLASMDRELLAHLLVEQWCKPGELIFKEGDSGDAMYLIWSGKVAIVKGSFQAPTILGYRGPGEVIGEMALLEGQPRSASAIALEKVRLLCISRASFQELLKNAPAIGLGLMAVLSARLREADAVRATVTVAGRKLVRQVTELETEKQHLLELQRVRQETSDFIIHDLRNPLGILCNVIGMLKVVLPQDVLEANRELLDMGDIASRRMQNLVDSLLDVARMETGEVQLKLMPVDLHSLAEQVGQRVALALNLGGITFCNAVPADWPTVMADQEKIDRVLANLMDNAIKYTPNEGKITIAARWEDENTVGISVTDTGPGIPPQERERIFERFAQVAGDKPRRRGFGLGLTFCKLTVEAHGGRIWVEPGEGGVGSSFTFTLPLSQE